MTFADDWQAWHRQKEDRLASPHGFLAITAIHWLNGQPQRFDGLPGAWWTDESGVHVRLEPGESLQDDGRSITGSGQIGSVHDFGVIPERGGHNVDHGDIVIEIAKRGGYDILRPRDPKHPLLTRFTGTPAYEPSPDWVLTGRYTPFEQPRAVPVGAAVEGLQHVYESPGQVEFARDGRTFRLTAFNGKTPGALNILFTDQTSGVTTYAANRSLDVEAPAPDGTVTLDFNRAANLPCAYTDLATCPLPPAENRLDLAVETGEKIPYERQE